MPDQNATGSRAAKDDDGVWIAYYADRSGIYPFQSEVDALRFAVEMHSEVKFVKWGEGV